MMLVNFTLNNDINTQLNALTTKLKTINKSKNKVYVDSNLLKLESDLKALQKNIDNFKHTKITLDTSEFKKEMKALNSEATKTLKGITENKHKIEFDTSGAKALSGDVMEISKAFDKLNNSMNSLTRLNDGITKVTEGFDKMISGAKQLGMYAGLLSGKALHESIPDEKYFARFNSLALKSKDELKEFTDLFRQYGKEVGMSAGEVADMATEYISAGGEASLGKVKGFLSSTLQAVTAGFVSDASTYSKTIKVIANNMGLDTAEAYKAINDNIVTIQNRGIITAEQYGQYAISAIPSAFASGMNFGDFNALIAVASKKMGHPSRTMTGMRQFISDLSGATSSAKQYAKELGVELDSRALREKGTLKYFQDLKQAILDSGDVIDGVSIKKLFGNTNSKAFVESILQDLEMLENELEVFKKTDTLTGMYEAVIESPMKQFQTASQTLSDSFSKLGSSLMPIFAEMMNSIAGVMEQFNAWIEQHPILFEWLVKITMALLALATVGLVVKSLTFMLGGAWEMASGAVELFKLGVDKLRIAGLLPLVGSMFKVIAVVGLFAYAWWFAKTNFGNAGDGIMAMGKALFSGLLTGIELVLFGIEALVQGLAFCMQQFSPFTQGVRALGELVGNETMANFKNPFALITEEVAKGIGSARASVGKYNDQLANEVKEAITTEDGKIKWNPFGEGGFIKLPKPGEPEETIKDYLEGVSGDIDWQDLVPELGEILPNGAGDIGDLGAGGINKVKEAVDEYAEAMKKLNDETKKWVDKFEDNIKMFDKVGKKVVNSSSLLKNAKDRATQMQELRVVKEQLGNKGLSDSVMAKISEMGVDKLAELKALNRMSATDLKQWDNYTTSTVDNSKAMAQQTITNIYVNAESNVADFKKIADNIYKELKRRNVKI